MTESFVIGVDAGGTKTTAWKASCRGECDDDPIATGHAGPGNVNSVGFETASANIRTAIESALEPADRVECVCICAAGAGRVEEQQRLHDWATKLNITANVVVRSDIDALLAAASSDSVGVALIAGTGSLAAGRNAAGGTHRAGGWGWLLGDEGGAYRIGLSALQRAVRMVDGRELTTPLLARLLDRLNVNDAAELIPSVYTAVDPRVTIGQLSADVFELAATGEAVSIAIIEAAARELAEMVQAVAGKLSLSSEYVLAMTGGVLMNQTAFRERVLSLLSREPQQITLVREPVRGAVQLARRAI